MKAFNDVQGKLRDFNVRIIVFSGLVLFCFSLLIARLVYLQVFQHQALLSQAESNRLSLIPSPPNRGLIYDRNGLLLTKNTPAYTLEITPSKVQNLEETIEALRQIVAISERDLNQFQQLHINTKSFDPTPIRNRLSDTEVARFAAQSHRFPGVSLKAHLLRNYPYGELGSHLIGYIGRINTNEKARLKDSEDTNNYLGTDYIGKVGLERTYEKALHGTTGMEQVETTAAGFTTRTIRSIPSIPGSSLHLSIDFKLQYLIEALFGKRRGALIAMNPNTGGVLALVSKPTFDPNLFLDGIDAKTWNALNESAQNPLLNRALRGTYPPGSTYKPFMGLAALEKNIRSASAVVNDLGHFRFGNHTFRGHAVGPVNLHQAIAQSSNVYFYSLANIMGVEAIYDFMLPLGFGQKTDIDLVGEVNGVLPNQAWKQKHFSEPKQKVWFPGETISLGIGQGYNSFTPLQLAMATATLANGKYKHTPHIVSALENGLTHQRTPIPKPTPIKLHYKKENIDLIHKAMADVPKPGGTSAQAFAGADYESAGKTGTAQAITLGENEEYDAESLTEFQRDHSLYVAFAPLKNPNIALAIVVENAGFGSTSAAPIARRVFDYWLLGEYPSKEDILAVQQGQATAPIGKPRKAIEIKIPTATAELNPE